MVIRFFIARDSTPAEIEEAYQFAALAYRTTVFDFARQKGVEVFDLAKNACEDPITVTQFVLNARLIPKPRDLNYLMYYTGRQNTWLERIKDLQIHASIKNSRPARQHTEHSLPEEIRLAATEAFNKMSWFYDQVLLRYMAQTLDA